MSDDAKKGLTIHLGIATGLNRETGAPELRSVDVLGAHAGRCEGAADSAEGVGGCSASSGAASDAYRDGWERIFGARRQSDAGPN